MCLFSPLNGVSWLALQIVSCTICVFSRVNHVFDVFEADCCANASVSTKREKYVPGPCPSHLPRNCTREVLLL